MCVAYVGDGEGLVVCSECGTGTGSGTGYSECVITDTE